MQNTDKVAELVRLLSIARIIADELQRTASSESMAEMYSRTVEAIDSRSTALLAGKLMFPTTYPHPGLGLYRGISDWCEDEALLSAAASVEDYYSNARA